VDQGKVYTKDGQEYGVTSSQVWRGRWWNDYERGSSYAAGEFWFEAIADLQEAIKQRDQDQRRTRTYGLHFVDYFPHREIGVVYYRLGRYADAIRELETSLQSAETAKAKFYLNKARRGQLEQTQGDTALPRVLVESPRDGLLTRQFTITVDIVAVDLPGHITRQQRTVTLDRQGPLVSVSRVDLAGWGIPTTGQGRGHAV
jgi:tetratricopeptide (TPR) repeat protein